MSYVVYYKLSRPFRRVISHGFEKTTNRSLVFGRDASELLDHLFLGRSKHLSERRRFFSCQHKGRIYSGLLKGRDVPKIQRVSTQLVIFLSPPTDSKKRSKLRLI